MLPLCREALAAKVEDCVSRAARIRTQLAMVVEAVVELSRLGSGGGTAAV